MKTRNNKLPLIFLFILIVLTSYAQPGTDVKELYRKRHFLGNTPGHPYTTFDRHNGKTFEETVKEIRLRIINENDSGPVYKAYQQVYNHANTTMPSDNGMPSTGVSELALWAKNNAFVMLIGLKLNGETLTLNERNYHKQKVLDAFDQMTGEIPDYEGKYITFYAGLGLTKIHPLASKILYTATIGQQIYQEMELNDKYKFYARSHILWVQAYDLLKASAALPELESIKYYNNFDSDANLLDHTPRNKLRYQTRNLYKMSKGMFGMVTHRYGWKQNHGIACAAALLISAQVLNDAGVENEFFNKWYSYIPIIGQITRLILEPMPHPNYSPINWHKFAKEGLYENLFVGEQWWPCDNSPTSPLKTGSDQYSPYSEGPGYAEYGLLDCGLPAMRAEQNFYFNGSQDPLLKKNEISNIFNWLNGIAIGDKILPTFDNTHIGTEGWELALTNNKDFNFGTGGDKLFSNTADYVALVGGNNISLSASEKKSYDNELAEVGNIVLRNKNELGSHYFQMLAEGESAIAKKSGLFGLGGTHEDDDLGSFMIAAGDSKNDMVYLGVDPPYFTWSDAKATNKYWMHNTIEIDDGNPAEDRTYKNPKYTLIDEGKSSKIQKFNLDYDFVNEDHSMFSSAIKRNVIANNSTPNFYYFMADYVDVDGIGQEDGIFQYIKLNLNGNGNKYINEVSGHTDSMTYRKVNGIHRWTYPCSTSYDNWSLSAHISVLGNSVSGTNYWEDYYTNDSSLDDGTKVGSNYIANGTITRLRIHQPNTYKTIFQSFLYPQKCGEQLPIVTKTEKEHLVSTTIIFVNQVDTISYESKFGKMGNITVPDSSSNFHFSKFSGNSGDSLLNPFNVGNKNLKIYFNSKEGYINYHSIAYMGQGVKYCPSTYSNFRNISFTGGSYLIFKDTLIFSDKLITFNAWLNGRHNYTCSVTPLETPTSTDSIKIKLSDVSPGVEMVAIASNDDTLPGRYDSLTNYFHMLIPTGKKEFVIQEKQACQDCYFPPLGTNFDTIFLADDGKRHILGNKKAINYPDGNITISNSTRISMCPGVFLQNKDSLIIEGPPQQKGVQIPTCHGIDSIASVSNISMLIVSTGSSLVLDAGSRTYIRSGGAIYVKQNGSLVIKDGAFLQIGDSTREGWGEIIAEQGSYIYIEPNAHIEYRRIIGDTSDRNLVVFASGSSSANAGIYYWMDSTLKAENIIDPVIYPIEICSLDSLVPFFNKEWGYTNFGKPVANLDLGNDTLCPGQPLVIRMNRILNDAMAEISVCRWDSIFNTDGFWMMECIDDSTLLDSIPPDPICRMPRTLPDEWVYYFDINTRHQVSLKLINECGRIVDTSFLVVVQDTPHFFLSLPEVACEGYQTVKAIARELSGDSIYYTFEVTEEVDTASLSFQIGNQGTIYSESAYGILPDTFDFPGYYFRGGRKHSISLSITNSCGTSTQYGIVEIPTGVYIQLERSTLYANPVHGARSVQLHGYANNIDSFRWEPSTWLNRTDTLLVTSTPEDSIAYTLLAFKDNCIAYDTTIIKVNHVTNAGIGDTICFDEGKILLGNAYDMTVFLGYLYFKGEVDFRNKFIIKTDDNEEYFRFFSKYMQTHFFKDWANSCSNLYTDFTENLMREQTINKDWYIAYFENFTAFNDPSMHALDSFKYYISNNYTLNSNYTSVNDWGNIGGCVDELFSSYENFVSDQLNTVSISWIKISGLDTTYNGSFQESSIAIDSPAKSSIYIQSVITDNYAEIDQAIIWVDTMPNAGFVVQFQFDSTVVFENFTQPKNAGNKYLWDFGDGTPNSFDENAIHEYGVFDSSFKVCLTVTNKCGTSTFCDTIYIDSAHWGGAFRLSENKTYFEQEGKPTNYAPDAIFYPNPMQNFGILSYRFKEEGETGNFYLRDSQGKLIVEKELKQQKDKLVIPTDLLAPGVYFYFIWSNQGNVFKGKLCK